MGASEEQHATIEGELAALGAELEDELGTGYEKKLGVEVTAEISTSDLFKILRDPRIAVVAAKSEYIDVQEIRNGSCYAAHVIAGSIMAGIRLEENARNLKRARDLLGKEDAFRCTVHEIINIKRNEKKNRSNKPGANGGAYPKPRINDASLTVAIATAGAGLPVASASGKSRARDI